jgi:hypothetical protein
MPVVCLVLMLADPMDVADVFLLLLSEAANNSRFKNLGCARCVSSRQQFPTAPAVRQGA